MDEFKDLDAELLRLKEELTTKDDTLRQVKFPAAGDYWKSRLDEERTLWDKKIALHSEERKLLEKKIEENREMLSRYDSSFKEMERKLESDTKLWEERLRLKEADILIEKNRLQCESRVREVEFERQKLIGYAAELNSKIAKLLEDHVAETEKLKEHSKREAAVYEEKIKLAATETRGLQQKTAEMEEGFKKRAAELESLKEEYRVRLEDTEKKLSEITQEKLTLENDGKKARTEHESDRERFKSGFESAAVRFGSELNRNIGVLNGLASLISAKPVKKSTLSIIRELAAKTSASAGEFEKELNIKFGVNDDFRVSLIMTNEDAAYWEAALSGSKIEVHKITPKSNVKKEMIKQKPGVCVVSAKMMPVAKKVRAKWPFIPVIIYGELTDKQAALLENKGFTAITHYSTADDMILTLHNAAKNSVAAFDYWDKIKVKSALTAPALAVAAAVLLCAGFYLKANPTFLERFAKVSSYSVPYSQPSNITFDGQYLWGCDWFGQSIYKHDTLQGLKLTRIFCFPGKHFTAITWGGGYLWSADLWESVIYKHNADDSLTVIAKYPAPGNSISGLAFDGKNLWSCDSATGMFYKHNIDETLSVEDAFESPGASPSGLYFDGKNLWSTDSRINKVYRHKMDTDLTVEASFIPPLYDQKNYNLSGIAIKNNKLWVCSEKLGKVFSFPKEKMEQVNNTVK